MFGKFSLIKQGGRLKGYECRDHDSDILVNEAIAVESEAEA